MVLQIWRTQLLLCESTSFEWVCCETRILVNQRRLIVVERQLQLSNRFVSKQKRCIGGWCGLPDWRWVRSSLALPLMVPFQSRSAWVCLVWEIQLRGASRVDYTWDTTSLEWLKCRIWPFQLIVPYCCLQLCNEKLVLPAGSFLLFVNAPFLLHEFDYWFGGAIINTTFFWRL